MRKILFILIFITNTVLTKSQPLEDLLTNPKTVITYLGIDFSHAKYFGNTGTVDTLEMIGLFNKINDLIVVEYNKYDIKSAIKKDSVLLNISLTKKINTSIDKNKLLTKNYKELDKITKDSVQKIVKNYNLDEYSDGIGFVFIVDHLIKRTEEEFFWVTFIDMKSKEVILTEKLYQIAEGFGFRNHWARPFYLILENMKYTIWKDWNKKYLGKKKKNN